MVISRLAIFLFIRNIVLCASFFHARRAACSSILFGPVDFPACFPATSAAGSRFSQFPFALNLPTHHAAASHMI